MSHKRRTTLENKVQRDIELALGAEPDLLLLRNSIGQATHVNENGKTYHVPYGLGVGSPDLVGLLRHSHRSVDLLDPPNTCAIWFCLEVKAEEGDLDEDQWKCHAIWRRFGAFIATVRSVDEALQALDQARKF